MKLGNNSFDGYFDQSFIDKGKLKYFYCPESFDYVLTSNYIADFEKIVAIKVQKGVNTTENNNFCKSTQEINDKIDILRIGMPVINWFFDIEDYDEPIKTSIEDNHYWSLLSDKWQYIEINVRPTEVTDTQNIFALKPKKSIFYSAESVNYRLTQAAFGTYNSNPDANFVLEIDLKLDDRK